MTITPARSGSLLRTISSTSPFVEPPDGVVSALFPSTTQFLLYITVAHGELALIACGTFSLREVCSSASRFSILLFDNNQVGIRNLHWNRSLSMLKPHDIIVPPGPVGLEDKNSLSQSYSLPLINSIAGQEKRSLSTTSFTSSENPLSIIDWTSDETVLDNPTPASSVNSDLSLPIDPRLLNESDPQPIILPS